MYLAFVNYVMASNGLKIYLLLGSIMQFVNLNGITLHYQQIGLAMRKPTIVFSNSLGTDFRIWRDVVTRLADDFSFLLYDKRGHGLSDVGNEPYTIQTHVDDLVIYLCVSCQNKIK